MICISILPAAMSGMCSSKNHILELSHHWSSVGRWSFLEDLKPGDHGFIRGVNALIKDAGTVWEQHRVWYILTALDWDRRCFLRPLNLCTNNFPMIFLYSKASKVSLLPPVAVLGLLVFLTEKQPSKLKSLTSWDRFEYWSSLYLHRNKETGPWQI